LKCRTIEHTADIGIEVEAGSLEELFAGAATGMYSLIVDPSTVLPGTPREVALEAGDLEELMFKWLNELLYLLGSEGLLLSRIRVNRIEELRIEASVEGEPADPGRHQTLEEIKAATYHDMRVEHREDGWFARIIFDV
jgi:SHS2 domain-containing protein